VTASSSPDRVPPGTPAPPGSSSSLRPGPSSESPEGRDIARRLLVIAAIRVAVVTLSLGALVALWQLEPPDRVAEVRTWDYLLVAATYGLSLGYTVALRYPQLVQPLAYAQVVLDAVIVSALVATTGGVESIFSFAYVFVVLGASTTLYRRGALLATLTSCLMYGTILGLQIERGLELLPPVETAKGVLSFFMQCVGTSLAGILSSALSEQARTTRRRLREKQSEFQRLEELHAAILRSLPAGLLTVDSDGLVRYANDAALAILRVDRRALEGQQLAAVVPAMRSGLERKRSASSVLPERLRERFEEPFRRHDGTQIRLGFSFAPLFADTGPSTLVVFQDVTDVVRLKEAVERSERLATVGKFAAGLAHEVRNPLAAICASVDVLKATLAPPEPMQRLMNNVVIEAERLDQLITSFLAFARPRRLSVRLAELGPVVSSVVEIFRNQTQPKAIRLTTRIEAGVTAVIDDDMVRQVVWNLLRNAAEAMEKRGGDLMVEVFRDRDGPALVVRDTGPGIPPEVLKRVFDPFFTTKERGSGLGLAITHSVVEAHGGKLSIESRAGVGTEVQVRFRSEIDTADLAIQQSTGEEASFPGGTTDELDILVAG
jgi:two-component system sensor histidine kinase PilS (NtrC family)